MASLKDIKVNINVDTTGFIKSLRQLQERIKMDNARILKGYSKEERKELEEAKDNGFLSVIALICSIKRDDDNCHALYEKYYREDTNGNNQMAKDIIDFYCGNAKFPVIKEYTATVKAEVFDGSDEMMSRYPIRHFPKSDLLSERWVLDIPTPYDDYSNYPANLLKGQVLVTLPDGTVVNMNPYDFAKLFLEAEK